MTDDKELNIILIEMERDEWVIGKKNIKGRDETILDDAQRFIGDAIINIEQISITKKAIISQTMFSTVEDAIVAKDAMIAMRNQKGGE